VTKHVPLVNAAVSLTRFESSPESMLAAMKQLRNSGLDVLAVYHSHPTTPPTPSKLDVELNYAPGVLTVIISLMNESPEIVAWDLDVDPPRRVTVDIS